MFILSFNTKAFHSILYSSFLLFFSIDPESADSNSSNNEQIMPQYPYDMNSTVPYNYQYPYDMTSAVSNNYQYPYPYDASSAAYSNYQYPFNTSATVPTNNHTAPPQNQSVKSNTCIIA
ncbi:unnamed protein product [Rotaria magnacalcarata]|uniref:Uncharacterized protein n=1 Tax=Rotaria magnacalcarata TaxID=392030 RepID=A0A819UQJ3_9BILA|nr:unnamed protein product [Rotaria magnacalcarata]